MDKYVNGAIARTKFRIQHHEKHGNGIPAMEDKERLKKQLRSKQLRDERLK